MDGVPEQFGFAEMQVVSFEDLFGRKLRPPARFKPSSSEIEEAFGNEFEGMPVQPVSLIELKDARRPLTGELRAHTDDKAMRFLLSS